MDGSLFIRTANLAVDEVQPPTLTSLGHQQHRLFFDPNSVLPSPTTFFNSLTSSNISPTSYEPASLSKTRELTPFENYSQSSLSAANSERDSSPASSYLATPAPSTPDHTIMDIKPDMLNAQTASIDLLAASQIADFHFAQQSNTNHQYNGSINNNNNASDWFKPNSISPFEQQQQQQYYQYPAPPQAFDTPQGTFFFVPHQQHQQQFQPPTPPIDPVMQPQPLAPNSIPESLLDWESEAVATPPVAVPADSDNKPHVATPAKPAAKQSKRKVASSESKKKRAAKQQVKRFVCPQPDCGRAFARNFNMQSHLKSHFNIREFSCPMNCGKRFSRRHDCARHVTAVHENGGRSTSPDSEYFA